MPAKPLQPAEIPELLAKKSGTTVEQAKAVLQAQAELAYERAAEGFPIPGIGVLAMLEQPRRKIVISDGPQAGKEFTDSPARRLKFRLSRVATEMVTGRAKALPDLFEYHAISELGFSFDALRLPDPSEFIASLGSNLTLAHNNEPASLIVQRLSDFSLQSRYIGAADVLTGDGKPFVRAIAPGRYPLVLVIADVKGDERIAFAMLRFSPARVARWELAEIEDQEVIGSAENPIIDLGHYGVDSGTGAFFDASTLQLLNNLHKADIGFSERVADEMRLTHKSSRSWVHIETPSGSIVVFTSGYGDGSYPSFFGLDAAGNPVALVTDFGIVNWDKPT